MIEDALERQKAIILLLGDAAPDTPVSAVPGYILAVEARLEQIAAEEASEVPCPPQYAGKGGPAMLVKDMASVPAVEAMARSKALSKTAAAILREVPGVGSGRAFGAARSIINLFDDDPTAMSTLSPLF